MNGDLANGDEARLHSELESERAAARHWRALAQQQRSTLDAIKRRPVLRAALALDTRLGPLRTELGALRAWASARADRSKLTVLALPTRRDLPARRAQLAATIERLPAMKHGRREISIVVTTDRPLGATPSVGCGLEPEFVVVLTADGAAAPPEADRLVTAIAESATSAASRGAQAASGELLCFLAPTTEPLEDGWLARLAGAISDATVAAVPLLVHPERRVRQATPDDLRVRELGLDVVAADGGYAAVRARAAGEAPTGHGSPVEVFAGSGACLLVDRGAYEEAGGLAPLSDIDAAMIDLCWRLRARGGRIVAVGESVASDGRPVKSVAQLTQPIDPHGTGWRAVVDRHGPALLRSCPADAARDSLRVALTVAAPSAKVAPRWGDWHLAEALARSLCRLGHAASVQTVDHADDLASRSADVHVVLRGQERVRRAPGQRHVLWVISHPEMLDVAECDEADLVLVASSRFAAHVRALTTTPVEVMLQATDHRRFRPVRPDPSHAHPVAIVAKTRDVLRPVIADALAAGLRPAIYGTGWGEFVDPTLVVADYVPNEDLPTVYSSVGVLLNDHWDTMRAWGFVSNRIFDALACGAPVISDEVPEVADLFGESVPMYGGPDRLRALVDAALGDPTAARTRATEGRQRVLEAHTFDHRARALLETLARHGLDRPPG
jgi:glycosyltransferase involved in cell wall biosynthesis